MPTEYDFSSLPDVVWVDVLTRLSLSDRARTALSCQRLNDVFNHPSVWRSVDVVLIGTLPFSGNGRSRYGRPTQPPGVIAPDRYVAMIRRFGAYFQVVRLTVRGEVCELHETCREVLEQLASCRLERLTLKVGEGTVQRKKPTPAAADALLALIKQAQRLRSLDIRSWPLSDTDLTSCDIIASMRDNERLRRLERLSLFCRDPSEDSWVPLTTRLPTSSSIVDLLRQLSALTSLCLHSTLLTTKLIEVLCQPRRAPLSRLGIMVVYRRSSVVGYDAKFPQIQDSTWMKLRESNPDMGVELTFCNTIPSYELMSLLSAELPVTSVAFMKYSGYKPDVLTCLEANYHRTLVKFADYGDTESGNDAELSSMVTRSTRLCRLIYHGAVRPSTVLELAAVRAGSWSRLEVNVSWTLEHGDSDDDVLFLQPGTESYAIAAHLPGSMFYHDDVSDQQLTELYQSLCEQVTDIVGYKWQPLNKPG